VYGNYVDYLALPFAPMYVAGPSPESASVTQAWNPAPSPPLGLGEFDINPTAAFVPVPGSIGVDYTVYSQDPNNGSFDPDTAFVSTGQVFASVQVDIIPEPGSFSTVGGAILALAGFAFLSTRRARARL